MSLRKEQVLLICTALLLGLLAWASRGEAIDAKRGRARTQSYDKLEVPARVVQDGDAIALADVRDPFRKPTRTVPLPPLDAPALELPPLPELPIVAPPLDLGPGIAEWHRLRVDPKTHPVVLPSDVSANAGPASSARDNASSNASGADVSASNDEKTWAISYDRVETIDGRTYWGKVLGDDRFAQGSNSDDAPLVIRKPFRKPVLLRHVDPETGKQIVGERSFETAQIDRVTFANTIGNRLALARRRIAAGPDGVRDRERLVTQLLTKEAEHTEALDEAERQARKIVELVPDDARGWELLTVVYARTAQFEKQLALFDELANSPFGQAAFVARAQGDLNAQLGLDEDAESLLREAVRKDASDPSNTVALARYLLVRGRDVEGLEYAKRARQSLAPSHGAALRFEVLSTLARAALAAGDTQLASRTVDESSVVAAAPQLQLMRGASMLAKSQVEEARAAFVAAAASLPLDANASLGSGLCAFRAKSYMDAMRAFLQAEGRDPLERHRAVTAQAFLRLLTKDGVVDALGLLERAQLMAPRNPYVLYLSGRAYRMSSRFAEAREALDECLRIRYDFVEAAMEFALASILEARQSGPTEGFALLENAERIAARACSLEKDRGKLPLFQELLGIVRYHLRKDDRARVAFQTAETQGGGAHAKCWLALLRNRQGHSDDAIAMLRNTTQYLKDPADVLKVWAEVTRKRLAVHRGKRLVRDDFEAQAKHWQVRRNGQQKLRFQFGDGQLTTKGTSNREVPAWSRYTIDRARDFVSVTLDADFGSTRGAKVYLRVSDEKAAGGGRMRSTIDARIGWDGEKPFAYLRRGAQETDKTTIKVDAQDKPALFARDAGPVRLEIAYEIRVEEDGEDGSLVIRWAGQEVARKKTRLSSGNRELFLDVRIEPQIAAEVDAKFSRFRLIRMGQ